MVTGGSREELLAGLGALASGAESPLVTTGAPGLAGAGGGKTVVVFPGQGSQYPGMGRELRERSAVFAAVFDQACEVLSGLLDVPVAGLVLNGSGEELAGTAVAQAGLFAVGAGLSRLLEASGIVPDIVLGHSAGEVAAAYAAGVLSLQDACALVAARGALMQGLPPGGAMAALAAGEDEVAAMLGRFGGGAVIAAVNGPAAVTVSGEAAAVEAAAGYWRARGRKVTLLGASRAFHSPRMDPVLAPLAEAAAALSYQEPGIALVSGLTGQPAREEDFRSAAYWAAQARQPVRYAAAVAAAYDLGGRLFIEAGPTGPCPRWAPTASPASPAHPAQRQDGQDGAGGQAPPAAGQSRRPRPRPRSSSPCSTPAGRGPGSSCPPWPGCTPTGRRSTGPRSWPARTAAASTCRPTRSSGNVTGRPARRPRPAGPVPGGSAGGGAVLGRGRAPGPRPGLRRPWGRVADEVAAVLPALAAWRRRERDSAAADGWRYRVAWEPARAGRAAAWPAPGWPCCRRMIRAGRRRPGRRR